MADFPIQSFNYAVLLYIHHQPIDIHSKIWALFKECHDEWSLATPIHRLRTTVTISSIYRVVQLVATREPYKHLQHN